MGIQTTGEAILLLGYTFSFLGELLVAYAALAVHHRFRHEHKVDEDVFLAMRREQRLAIIGIIMFVLGYIAKIASEFILF